MGRKTFSNNFKAKVALEAVKAGRTANEIASQYGIHVTQVNNWKKQLVDRAAELFDRKNGSTKAHEEERDRLYQQIGKLQVQLELLRKRAGDSN